MTTLLNNQTKLLYFDFYCRANQTNAINVFTSNTLVIIQLLTSIIIACELYIVHFIFVTWVYRLLQLSKNSCQLDQLILIITLMTFIAERTKKML